MVIVVAVGVRMVRLIDGLHNSRTFAFVPPFWHRDSAHSPSLCQNEEKEENMWFDTPLYWHRNKELWLSLCFYNI